MVWRALRCFGTLEVSWLGSAARVHCYRSSWLGTCVVTSGFSLSLSVSVCVCMCESMYVLKSKSPKPQEELAVQVQSEHPSAPVSAEHNLLTEPHLAQSITTRTSSDIQLPIHFAFRSCHASFSLNYNFLLSHCNPHLKQAVHTPRSKKQPDRLINLHKPKRNPQQSRFLLVVDSETLVVGFLLLIAAHVYRR